MNTLEKKQANNLGFRKLETVEIVKALNISLSTYQVFFHKLQNFHWNVKGGDFFDIHDTTQAMYETALLNIDEIAERVRVFGHTPTNKMQAYLDQSLIKESQSDLSSEFMARQLITDLQTLIESFISLHEAAARNGDLGSALMASQMIKALETNHWKLSAWCDRKFQLS